MLSRPDAEKCSPTKVAMEGTICTATMGKKYGHLIKILVA